MPESAYIHIPFCKSKCKYCSFVSMTDISFAEDYVCALIKDIKNNYEGENLSTLYFGGGTPSLLKPEKVAEILDCFNFSENTEVTFEINPDDAGFEYLKELKNTGINRISMGSQTFDNNILKIIGRRHNSETTLKAVENTKKAGFENISLDLIYGLPNQTEDILLNDLKTLISLDIQHISTYGLKIEEPSYFSKNLPQNLPDDDKQADMYLLINDFLEKNNYKRYEISNFSKEGFESRHNLNYWNNSEYYGFGLAAHGYKDGIRYSNLTNIKNYLTNPDKKAEEHTLTEKEKLEEEIFLGFRRTSGIDVNIIQKKYGFDFENEYKEVLKKYTPEYIEKTENGYKLTLKGILLSNIILAEFI